MVIHHPAVDDSSLVGQAERGDVSRRGLLRLALAGAGVVATGPALSRTGLFGGDAGAAQQAVVPGVISGSAPMKGPVVRKFERELLIPPVIEPTETRTETVLGKPAQVKYYDLVQKKGSTDLLPAPFPQTEIWGYNGIYPGPTFTQTTNGAYTVVRNTNTLPNPTSTHLHSSPTQPAHDGHPDDLTYAKGTVPAGAVSEFDGGTALRRDARLPLPQQRGDPHALVPRPRDAQDRRERLQGAGRLLHPGAGRRALAKFGLDKLPKGKYDVPLLVGDMQFDDPRPGRLRRQGPRQPLGQRHPRQRPGLAEDDRGPHPLPLPGPGRRPVPRLQLRDLTAATRAAPPRPSP